MNYADINCDCYFYTLIRNVYIIMNCGNVVFSKENGKPYEWFVPTNRCGKNVLCEYILFTVVEFSRFSWEPAVCKKDSDREHQLRKKGPWCVYRCAAQCVHVSWLPYQLFLSSAHSSQLSTTPANRCVMRKIHLSFFHHICYGRLVYYIRFINKN